MAPRVRRAPGSLPGWAPAPAPQVKPAVHPMFVRPWEEGAAGAEVPERLVAMETGRLLLTGVVAVSGEPQLLSPRGQPCTWADAAGGRPGPQAIPGVPPSSPLDVRSPGGLKVTGGCASPAGRLHPHEGLSESRCPLGGTSRSLRPRGRGPPGRPRRRSGVPDRWPRHPRPAACSAAPCACCHGVLAVGSLGWLRPGHGSSRRPRGSGGQGSSSFSPHVRSSLGSGALGCLGAAPPLWGSSSACR